MATDHNEEVRANRDKIDNLKDILKRQKIVEKKDRDQDILEKKKIIGVDYKTFL
jgi:hypothetical protein